MQYREEEHYYLAYDIEFGDPTKELQLKVVFGYFLSHVTKTKGHLSVTD